MNWIYELTLFDRTDRSKKVQRARSLLKDILGKPEGNKILFSEVTNSLKSAPDAQLGFLTIFERYLLPQMIENKAFDASTIDSILKFALQLHANLIRLGNQKKLQYSLKIFNKIFLRLAPTERELLTQSRHHLIARS
jgi:hypothetical protein